MLLLTKDKVRCERAQRIYTNENVTKPESGTQIFCGNLPRNMCEIELFPYFSIIGEIYEFRLMMEFSGFSRGFCFVTYTTVANAYRAIDCLHGYILKDRQLSAYISWDNTKLFLHGIPPTITPLQIKCDLQLLFPGIINVKCQINKESGLHKGWAFLEFGSHQNASICRKSIWPNKLVAWGGPIRVEWARPIRSPDKRMACTLILFNVPSEFSRQNTYELVKQQLKTSALVHIEKQVGSSTAKLEFISEYAAHTAWKSLKGLMVNNHILFARREKSLHFE